jgi:AcrR family transcriptional regulator
MGRPSKANGHQTRQAILDAALELFADKGYFGTSLRDIATAVGIRESAIYNYFPAKEALFDQLIAAQHEQKMERILAILEGPIDDAAETLERFALVALESFCAPRQQQTFRMLMADGMRLAKEGRINLLDRLSSGHTRVRELMQRLIRDGRLARTNPDLLVMEFIGPLLLWRHLHALGRADQLIQDRDAFAHGHVERFLRGAAARDTATRAPSTRRARSSGKRGWHVTRT